MQLDKTIIDQTIDRQIRMFRIATDATRYGLTLKIIAADSGLGYDSVRKYAAGETQMPLSAFNALTGVLPNELLSLLLESGHQLIAVPDGIDHDELEDACRDYLKAKSEAHKPESPAGREISACEDQVLDRKAARLRAVA